MLDGGRGSLEISVFYTEFFHQNSLSLNRKAQKVQRLRMSSVLCSDYRSGIPITKEVFLPCTVKEVMLLQIS